MQSPLTEPLEMKNPRAPQGMEMDDSGNLTPKDMQEHVLEPLKLKQSDMIAQEESGFLPATVAVSFPNLLTRPYSKEPYYLRDWYPKVRVLAVRLGGRLKNKLGEIDGITLTAIFDSVFGSKEFVRRLVSEYHVPMEDIEVRAMEHSSLKFDPSSYEDVNGSRVYLVRTGSRSVPEEGSVYNEIVHLNHLPRSHWSKGMRVVLDRSLAARIHRVEGGKDDQLQLMTNKGPFWVSASRVTTVVKVAVSA